MNLLCLDTSTNYATCAICDADGRLLYGVSERHDRSLSTNLYPLFDRVFDGAGLSLAEIGIFAVGIGPGSFTGVRVAVTTLRTLAQVTGKKLVAIGTLDALAYSLIDAPNPENSALCAALPSRRDEVYSALYRQDCRSTEPATAAYGEIRQLREDESCFFVGPQDLRDLLFPGEDLPRWTVSEAPSPEALAALAALELREGRFSDPLGLDPMYVAPPAVSRHKQAPLLAASSTA